MFALPGISYADPRQPVNNWSEISDIRRLLSSFAKDLVEITLIALPEDMHGGQTSKAVQLHSYHDPSKSKLLPLTPS